MPHTSHASLLQLDDWSVITVTGPDATDFLQNQLTNSVKSIQVSSAGMVAPVHTHNRFAGYCSAKGRLMASFWITRQNVKNDLGEEIPQYQLLISSDLAQALSKRLSMFVLRSKVKVIDQSASHKVFGLIDHDNQQQGLLESLGTSGVQVAELPVVQADGIQYKRYIVTSNTEHNIIQESAGDHQVAALKMWNWLEIQSGIPRITHLTYEQFVPQMVNMESLKGIDFQKGCYPGQEVVARSQYRGTIKRRLQIGYVNSNSGIAIGTEIFHSEDPSQPCGMVVLSGSHPDNDTRLDLQVECKLEALERGSVHLGSPTGPAIQFMTLPYPLIEI